MQATLFEFAFFALIGLAILGLFIMATVATVFWLKVTWLWLKPLVKAAREKHA